MKKEDKAKKRAEILAECEARRKEAMEEIINVDTEIHHRLRLKKRIYFAHPFKLRGSVGEHDILTMLEEAGYDVVEPFADEQMILHRYGLENYYDDPRKDIAEAIFRHDFEHVMTCDELFAWFPREVPCIGTAIELEWAYIADKITYAFSPVRHPFLLSMVDFLYTSWEQLEKEFKEDAKFDG